MIRQLKSWVRGIFEPRYHKRAFIKHLPDSAQILDLGIANASVEYVHALRPDIAYVGLDIADEADRKTVENGARIVFTPPEDFDSAILSLGEFDAVVSAHNIEHCNHPEQVISAACKVLRRGGLLYMAFPSEASVHFPSRKRTLNFYDDPTHQWLPKWREILKQLENEGMSVTFASPRYRPLAGFLIGLFFEPFVAPFKKKAPWTATWFLYGFEGIIWAKKL
jgi:SAM-dependent methyltransferase